MKAKLLSLLVVLIAAINVMAQDHKEQLSPAEQERSGRLMTNGNGCRIKTSKNLRIYFMTHPSLSTWAVTGVRKPN